MLKSLHIENIAVIEQTDIEFLEGFNVLTGETGAGKSIIIDAINAVLGERTSKELIRTGCESATVSALFSDVSDYALGVISECGYAADDGNILILRKLTHSGSSFKINGQPATAGILKTIGKYLINIHGQHDNQSLLDPDSHCGYIDRLAENGDLLKKYYNEFHHLNKVRKELKSYEIDEAQKQHEIELLEYQIKELIDADLKPGEIEEIKANLAKIQNTQQNIANLKSAYSYINGDELNDGAFSSVRAAQKEILSCKIENLIEVSDKLGEVLSSLDDTAGQIRKLIQDSESENLDEDSLRARLDYVYRIALKYGGTEDSALNYLKESQKRLESIKLSDKMVIELSNELDLSTERLVALGEELTASRTVAAESFKVSVTEILAFLDMPNVIFEVKNEKGKYTKSGCDNIEFMISTNAGETIKPLSRIASGGELSRVMLAIKSVLADKDDVDTLIFDEIDSGISGRAAQKVGNQLKLVSTSRQTLCVTHLAQIAAFAQNHLLIEKTVSGNRTYTAVKQLNGEDRVNEIARIMVGSNISENTVNTARELLGRNF